MFAGFDPGLFIDKPEVDEDEASGPADPADLFDLFDLFDLRRVAGAWTRSAGPVLFAGFDVALFETP